MAKKNRVDTMLEELKKNLGSNKLVIGTKASIKNLKIGKVKKIYLSSNCPATVKDDIMHYSKLNNAEIIELNQPNDELGVLCKKPFSISVLSLLK